MNRTVSVQYQSKDKVYYKRIFAKKQTSADLKIGVGPEVQKGRESGARNVLLDEQSRAIDIFFMRGEHGF